MKANLPALRVLALHLEAVNTFGQEAKRLNEAIVELTDLRRVLGYIANAGLDAKQCREAAEYALRDNDGQSASTKDRAIDSGPVVDTDFGAIEQAVAVQVASPNLPAVVPLALSPELDAHVKFVDDLIRAIGAAQTRRT